MGEQSDDAAEIIALIHANRIAIWTGDFEAWGKCFVHAPYTIRWGWWRHGGIFMHQGWDNLADRVRRDPPAPRQDFAFDTKVENLQLRISHDMAWATFDQRYPSHEISGFAGPGFVHEVRVFEKHDGRWKIAFLGFLDANAGAAGDVLLHLDGEGRVLWQSPAAIEALEQDDDLVIRAGRLRIRDSRTDQKLQAAIRWAAGLNVGLMSHHGSVPIVMEAGEGLPTKVWWVIADGGMVLFSMAGRSITEDRLEMAALIYGLSPAQKQVARHISAGLSLNEIAIEMKITTNTARTHLQRVYEKTGVRTQTALVRVLLSAAAPL
jgi:DNA-binding CsgD family transcriptional regulator